MEFFAERLHNLNYVSLNIESSSTSPVHARGRAAPVADSAGTDLIELSGGLIEVIDLPTPVIFYARDLELPWTRWRLSVVRCSRGPAENDSMFPKFKPPRVNGEPIATEMVRWKPLPSEHWAELMDAWHCHKPHEPVTNDKPQKGLYDLALNGFHAEPRLAYFSETYFLVHRSDLSLAGQHLAPKDGPQSVKIWRWDLGEPVSLIVREIVRELVDAHAVYTIVVNDRLCLWILGLHADAATRTTRVENGIKLLYVDIQKNPEALDQRPDPEHIDLPDHVLTALESNLEAFNAALPSRLKKINGWNLGML